MKVTRLFALLVLLTATTFTAGPAFAQGGKGTTPAAVVSDKAIPGQYIVVLKNGASVTSLLNTLGIKPSFTYSSVLNGFAAKLSDTTVALLRSNPLVDYVEADQIYSIDTIQSTDTNGDPWGLDRIDQRELPLSGSYTYNGSGAGVTAYIIDTGIQTNHPDFGGRAAVAYDALGGNGQDCNGHGTHVSGTVGGTTYGVAKSVQLRAVRVLDCEGSGATSGIVSALDWVSSHAAKPAVANMSLGGLRSSALNTAAASLANSGIFLAVAAGNETLDACLYSPASADAVFTVAASDISDTAAYFSNFGTCVEAYAPGVDIKSDWFGSSTNTISGTSMASPHVAGLAALYKGAVGDASSSAVSNWLISNSTSGAIFLNIPTTPNRLVFSPAP